MEKIIIALVIVVALMFITAAIAYADTNEPDTFWAIPNIYDDDKIRWVPVYYVEEDFYCKYSADLSRGCFFGGGVDETITIVKSKEFQWARQGCTVHDHEFYHAMGYAHGEGPLGETCPNPNPLTRDNSNMQYDQYNLKHKDLTKDFRVVKDLNPQMIKWF